MKKKRILTYLFWILVTEAVGGLAAWLTGGLESSCAMHIVNNMAAFYLTGLGYG